MPDIHEEALNDALLTPQFLSEEEEALFAEAAMGQEAIDFLNSDLGRVLRGMAIHKRKEAMEALVTAPIDDTAKCRQLQFEAAVAGQFLGFIQEVLTAGELAEERLIEMRQ